MHFPGPPPSRLGKNKTGTFSTFPVKPGDACASDVLNDARCAFVAREPGTEGRSSPFCDAPALRGSAYCAEHHAVCDFAPGSEESERLGRDLDREAETVPPPPEELSFLASVEIPEPEPDEEPEDLSACLDGLPKPQPDFE